MTGMVKDLEPNADVLARAAGSGYATATDLADWLVRELGLPFRQAHHVTGRLVGAASAKGVGLEELSLPEMQEAEPRITDAVYAVLGVANSVASRTSYGGTAPDNVRAQAQRWIERLG
jgi:argininosuccinate lyase